MADLWNLVILNEMVSRPHVQMALKKMAALDLADTKRPWGGLIFYENGQAEAKLYPAAVIGGGDDLIYHPSTVYQKDARSSLCRFYAHFDKVENAGRAGPTAEELRDAAENNAYGLVVTRISQTSFCALLQPERPGDLPRRAAAAISGFAPGRCLYPSFRRTRSIASYSLFISAS